MFTAGIAYYTSRLFSKHTIYTAELAAKGELVTHNKDQAVLTLMNIKDEVERFTPIRAEWTLGELVKTIATSKRNVFPVLDPADIYWALSPSTTCAPSCSTPTCTTK